MRVLVTGSHGYVGSVLAPELVARGHEVAGVDTLFYEECDFGAEACDVPFERLDVRDLAPADLAGYEAVVHLAALSNDPLGDLDPDWTDRLNHEATVRLARAAREAGVRRFLFASSCSMYGTAETADRVAEEAPLSPLTAYARSKVRSEASLAELAAPGFSPVFLRFGTAYGVSPRLRVDVALNNLVAWAVTTGTVRLSSDGTPWRPLIHVQDMARAVAAVLEAPIEATHRQAFNVGRDSENYQIRELAEAVRTTVPGSRVELGAESGPDPRSYRVDFGKFARTFPDCRLTWDASAGARELYEAFLATGFGPDDFEGSRYTRLRRLKELLDSGRLDQDLRWVAAPLRSGEG